MRLTEQERELLDDYQHMMGSEAGRLALALDRLTDVMAMLGRHKVYCRVEKGPRAGQPPMDLAEILETLDKAKGLLRESLTELRSN